MKKVFTLIIASMMVSAAMAWDHMYIVGSGTSVGWNDTGAKEMTKISENEFEITDYFYDGEMKILCQQEWGAAYGPAHDTYSTLSDNGKESLNDLVRNAVYGAQGFSMGEATEYGDYKFKTTKGWYTIHINTEKNQISTYPRYIYPVGSGCEVEWNTDRRVTFQETEFGSGIYTGTVGLKASGELKFLCQKNWGVQFGPVVGGTGLAACGVYDVNFSDGSDANDRKWNMSIEEKNYHVAVDVSNGKMYVQPEQVTFKMHASEAAKVAMDNEVSFYWWNDVLGGGEWSVSEVDGWYTAIVTNAYMPINYLWHGKEWNSKTGDQNNFDQGFVENQTVIAAYNGGTIDDDKRQIELWYEDTYSNYGALTLTADAEHVAPGTAVTFTAAVADYAGTPEYTYYINGVEATLTDGKYTFANQGFYRVEVATTIDHQVLKASKEIFVEKTLTFKVHATNSLQSAWENIYFYSWQNYDGYDHVSSVQLETETDGFYTVEVSAVAPVKFLLKNKTADDWTGLQSVDMNNAEAGYTEGICVEIGSSKNSENKYLVNVLNDCQFTTYELTLGVDKETISEGETITFTPAVGEIEGLTYTYYVNDVETSLTDNQLTLAEWGKYSVKVTTEVEGNPLEVSKTITVTRNIKISAHINEAAMAILGEAKCFAWWEGGSMTQDMEKNDDVYETTFAAVEPIKFLIYNGSWAGYGGEQTVDMTNTVEGVDKGYDANRLVHVVEVKNNDNKMVCYHIDAVNTNKVTVNLYAEDAEWASAYFFTQNVAVETGYNNVFVHPAKGADNWYSYTYEGVNAVDWVARPNSDKWDNQVNDVAGLSGEKYLYVLADKHDNGHHKMADMVGKTLPQTLTYEFKFDGTAHTSWGNENPVVLRSWQYYSEDCAEAADHVKYIPMSADAEGVYSATLKAFNNVKMCLQSTDYGYHEDGSHWTVPTENNEEEVGFAESKKFWIKDNGSAHYLALTENFDFVPAVMSVTLNEKGFASFYWDRTCKIVGADAYIGKLVDDAVVLMKINGNGILQSKTAVILYGEPNTEVFMTETLDAGIGLNPYDNALTGTLVEFTPTGIFYALAEYEGETGFVKIDNGIYDLAVPANRAYLPIGSAAGAPRLRIRFAENTATDNANVNVNDNDNVNVNKVLRDGQLYIVRDGRMYNVLGK